MNKGITLAVMLFMAMACIRLDRQHQPEPSHEVTVMSYNVRHCAGMEALVGGLVLHAVGSHQYSMMIVAGVLCIFLFP